MHVKKIDKLIVKAFVRLFALVFFVALFVLLTQFFLLHFDQLVGKGLGAKIYAQLAFYISIHATPQAFPLAILLSSILVMSNLSQHAELIAMKSAGISSKRVARPLWTVAFLIGLFALLSNSYLVPRATLDAFSLLYDLRRKKPAVAVKEGVFYDGVPGYSIKVGKKHPDQTLEDIMIYDHTQNKGNVSLTLAAKGRICSTQQGEVLIVTLQDGYSYAEDPDHQDERADLQNIKVPRFYKGRFGQANVRLELEALKLSRTKKELFNSFYKVKNVSRLAADARQMRQKWNEIQEKLKSPLKLYADSSEPPDLLDVDALKKTVQNPACALDTQTCVQIYEQAIAHSKQYEKILQDHKGRVYQLRKEICVHDVERHRMFALAFMCLAVAIAGASLGSVLKKGGLGIPLSVATAFVVLYYALHTLTEKWAYEDKMSAWGAAWLPNTTLLPLALWVRLQARSNVVERVRRLFST